MIERRRQAGGVARILSKRRAELPVVNILGGLRRRSRALALIRVVSDMFSLWWRALVSCTTQSRALRAGTVRTVRGVRWVWFHGGHGRGKLAGV